MKHPRSGGILRLENTSAKCGRTSDAIKIADAQEKLEQYECEMPCAEAPITEPGMKTQRLNRRYKRSLTNADTVR